MRIGDYSGLNTYSPQQVQRRTVEQPSVEQPQQAGFGQQIKDAVEHVNKLQQTADSTMEQVAAGDTEGTHKAMIAMEHAMLALDFTLQVRNKMLEAYQEIMRTQV